MKSSLSTASSSSSTSISSFDGNLGNSRNATAGCLSGIFRRLLCTGSLPTYPSDIIKEAECVEGDHRQELKDEEKIEAPATPGIVARLMGLESLPEISWVPPGKTPDSIGRSRSVNSAYYWSEFDLAQVRHRRVRTALSFREAPTFLELENEDFFILSFENVVETEDCRSKGRKSEMGFGDLKPGRAEANRKKGNKRETVPEKKSKKEEQGSKRRVCVEKDKPERRISERSSMKASNFVEVEDLGSVPTQKKNVCRKLGVVSNSDSTSKAGNYKGASERAKSAKIPTHEKNVHRKLHDFSKTESPSKAGNRKEVSQRTKSAKKKKGRPAAKKVVPESNPENSSPVSVLDLGVFLIDPETPLSEEVKPRGSNSRRKLSPELANSDCPSPHSTCSLITNDRESRTTDWKGTKSKKVACHSQDYLELWGEICKVAEEDMQSSDWISRERSKLEELEKLGIEFGLEILDQLLHEIIDEFPGLFSENFVV